MNNIGHTAEKGFQSIIDRHSPMYGGGNVGPPGI